MILIILQRKKEQRLNGKMFSYVDFYCLYQWLQIGSYLPSSFRLIITKFGYKLHCSGCMNENAVIGLQDSTIFGLILRSAISQSSFCHFLHPWVCLEDQAVNTLHSQFSESFFYCFYQAVHCNSLAVVLGSWHSAGYLVLLIWWA